MCGIAGLISGSGGTNIVRPMIDSLSHRGPDDEGIWVDESAGVALGQRRLAIVDLTPSGHQPMDSADGRYVFVFNGEIYNHHALRREVEEAGGGPGAGRWRGRSDTETLVEAIALWGLEEALRRSVGMFAIALWDRKERRLQLARDRFGEKPLYYGWVGRDFVFGSELKALRAHPGFDNKVDRDSLRMMVARRYVPVPRSIYENIYKLGPAEILTLPVGTALQPAGPKAAGEGVHGRALSAYWGYADVLAQGLSRPFTSEEEALEALDEALTAAIAGQAIADVPVGAFLSGGVDSSTVVAFYQRHSGSSAKTYSIGFEEAGFNEAEYAKAVAAHFGTEHHERYVTAREAQEVIPRLPAIYDEPFADSSQIPTHIVSRFAREEVTVALSGDGGDELFGGYDRYFAVSAFLRRLERIPAPLRKGAGALLRNVPPALWSAIARVGGRGSQSGEFGFKMQRAAGRLWRPADLGSVYTSFLEEWWVEGSPVLDAKGADDCPFRTDFPAGAPVEARLMYCDVMSYLTDDILCKVDRAAMAVSLETRVPFLDHRVAAVAARVPIEWKMRDGKGKHILKQLLYRHAPEALFDRPKAGFGIPVGQWVRGPMRDWAEALLDEGRLRDEGYFDAARVRRRWEEHLSGRREATEALWPILMFQAWLEQQPSH